MNKVFIGVYFLTYEAAEKYAKARSRLIDYDYEILAMHDRGYLVVSQKQAEMCGIK